MCPCRRGAAFSRRLHRKKQLSLIFDAGSKKNIEKETNSLYRCFFDANFDYVRIAKRVIIQNRDYSGGYKQENGTRNPSLAMVKKLAYGLGMQLKLRFVPLSKK